MIRKCAVVAHRWIGLALAVFLALEGLTGSLLAFNTELTRLFNPSLFVASTPSDGRPPLDLATLAERSRAIAPHARLDYFASVRRDQVLLRMHADTDPVTRQPYQIGFKYLVLDPWTGRELGRLTADFHAQGFWANVMPVVYTLHTKLALGDTGGVILSVVALVWTVDCFVAFYLTLPTTMGGFWRRWRTSWGVKWPIPSPFRLNFDLHRAGGLWFWVLLLVFAWSSVVVIWPGMQIAERVTGLLVPVSPMEAIFADRSPHPARPRLDWRAAQAVGNRLVAQQAALGGFTVGDHVGFAYLEGFNLYSFDVVTDRAFPRKRTLDIMFDGDDGTLYEVDGKPHDAAGNVVMDWFRALHMTQDPMDGLLYRVLVGVVGLVITMLSVTGIYIWWHKRQARTLRRPRAAKDAARLPRSAIPTRFPR